jgi:hypothetical protein
VGELGRSAAQDDGEVHVRRLPAGRALAVQRVGVPVDHPQPQRSGGQAGARERAGQDAAVAAEHERPLPAA